MMTDCAKATTALLVVGFGLRMALPSQAAIMPTPALSVKEPPPPAMIASDNPYAEIVVSNVFRLRPATPVVPAPEIKPPPPKVELIGITTFLGKAQAIMKAPPAAARKPGEEPKEICYMLGERERDGDVEVLAIDVVESKVKIKNEDVEQTLELTNTPTMTASAPAAVPGSPEGAGIPAISHNPRFHGAARGALAIPTRTLHPPGSAGG